MTGKSWIHSSTSFDDMESVSLLSYCLSKSRKVMPDFKANDKRPNIDWYIEMINDDWEPYAWFRVQIKKAPKTLHKRKSFYCTKKFWNFCKKYYTWYPILLILVDLDKEQCYWVDMNPDSIWASSTIKIDTSNVITSTDFDYIVEWEKILETLSVQKKEYFKFVKISSIIWDIVSPQLSLDQINIHNIHLFLDEYNKLIEHDIPIVKKLFFWDIWKIWLAFEEYTVSSAYYFLYGIPYWKNDIQIKQLNETQFNKLKQNAVDNAYYYMWWKNDIENDPVWYARKEIYEKYLKTILEFKLFDNFIDDEMVQDYLFWFFRDKDKISINEVKALIDEIDKKWSSKLSEFYNLKKCLKYIEENNLILVRQKPELDLRESWMMTWYDKDDAISKFNNSILKFPEIYNKFLKRNLPNLFTELDFRNQWQCLLVSQLKESSDDRSPWWWIFYFVEKNNLFDQVAILPPNAEVDRRNFLIEINWVSIKIKSSISSVWIANAIKRKEWLIMSLIYEKLSSDLKNFLDKW